MLDLVCCLCDPGTIHDILCSWFFSPALAARAQRMLFYVPDLVSHPFAPSIMYVILYVPNIVCSPSTVAQRMLFYLHDIVSCPVDPGTMYVILCFGFSLMPLWHRYNVCHSMFLISYPAPLTLPQCMLFYVTDSTSCPFDPSTMYVILCPWYNMLHLQPRHNVWYSMFLL